MSRNVFRRVGCEDQGEARAAVSTWFVSYSFVRKANKTITLVLWYVRSEEVEAALHYIAPCVLCVFLFITPPLPFLFFCSSIAKKLPRALQWRTVSERSGARRMGGRRPCCGDEEQHYGHRTREQGFQGAERRGQGGFFCVQRCYPCPVAGREVASLLTVHHYVRIRSLPISPLSVR